MTKGFIKDDTLLEETSKVRDLLDYSIQRDRLVKKLDALSGVSTLALVGPFGSGKSTFLHRVMSEKPADELWMEFDAWKYPDRKDLWEGFVLDLAKAISPGDFKKASQKIAGSQHEDKKALVNTL